MSGDSARPVVARSFNTIAVWLSFNKGSVIPLYECFCHAFNVSLHRYRIWVNRPTTKTALGRRQILADRIYLESQCGFRTGGSTIDMIFSVRNVVNKEDKLYIAFIDLTKAVDIVSRNGLFKLLEKIGCSPKLLSVISSFHDNMKGTVNYDGATSEPFVIRREVDQGCVLTPTLFSIFFSLMLSYAFGPSTKGVYFHTRTDGKLFNVARLRAKTKVRRVFIREVLFADDATLATHTEEDLQQLMDRLSHASKKFGLTIGIKKANVMGQDVVMPPSINNVTLEVVDSFRYLGSTITSNLSLDVEINIHIAKAAAIMSKLNRRGWSNNSLTENTKLHVYQACVPGMCTRHVYQACVPGMCTRHLYQACVPGMCTRHVYQACVPGMCTRHVY